MNSFQNVLDNSKFFKYKNFLLTPRQRPALRIIVNCLPQTPPVYWTAVKLFSYYVLDDLPIKTVEVASHLHFCAVSTSVLVWAQVQVHLGKCGYIHTCRANHISVLDFCTFAPTRKTAVWCEASSLTLPASYKDIVPAFTGKQCPAFGEFARQITFKDLRFWL